MVIVTTSLAELAWLGPWQLQYTTKHTKKSHCAR